MVTSLLLAKGPFGKVAIVPIDTCELVEQKVKWEKRERDTDKTLAREKNHPRYN